MRKLVEEVGRDAAELERVRWWLDILCKLLVFSGGFVVIVLYSIGLGIGHFPALDVEREICNLDMGNLTLDILEVGAGVGQLLA